MRAALSLTLSFALALAAAAPARAQEQDPQTETDQTTLADAEEADPAEQAEAEAVEEEPALRIIDASEVTLEEFRWVARPIIVFADTPRDPRFQDQIDLLLQRPGPLLERDVVVIVDSDPDARSDARQTLRPRGFSMVILQRDGSVALRKPAPWHVREIMRVIDNLPMRIDEMRNAQ